MPLGLPSNVLKQIESPVRPVLNGLGALPLLHQSLELGVGHLSVVVGVQNIEQYFSFLALEVSIPKLLNPLEEVLRLQVVRATFCEPLEASVGVTISLVHVVHQVLLDLVHAGVS